MIWWREQKHICGPKYLEVDLFAVSARQHRATARAKKSLASSLAQQRYNDRRAKRYHVQLVNANFKAGDLVWTGTCDDRHRPQSREQADRDFGNFILRLYRWCKKHGVRRPKWIAATEYETKDGGGVIGRYHHHAIFERTEGLTRDALEQLWRAGFTRCEPLQTEHGSAEALVRYISKNRRCDRSWRQSRGLMKPVTPAPNDSRWSRAKVERASTLLIDDAAFWERTYPGYTFTRCETAVSETGYRHTVIIMHREEAGPWAGDRERARRSGPIRT